MACEQSGAVLRVVPVTDRGELDLESYYALLNDRTRMVALVHVSNTLGTINPVKHIIEAAHERDVPVLLDGAQAVPHMAVDVQSLDVDFYAFSGHKLFGPTGIGVLYGKEAWLNRLSPYQGGGSMIRTVSFEGTTYTGLPHKLEAGTPHIAGAIGMAAALDYVTGIGLDRIEAYESELSRYIDQRLSAISQFRPIGSALHKASVISFLIEGVHPYDTGTILDQLGIATRTGHHCTMPLMNQYHIPGTVRASFAFYNTKAEVDALADGILKVIDLFL
jgi:cysteine desulfurase/selenocysteine lyase